jgi:pimeloyl-ACP methyl ester carboxylesterase
MGFAVERWGDGPERIVLVHGSLGVGAAAFSEQKALADRFTIDVVTRRGYGDTAPISHVDVAQDARDVVEVLAEGAHLVGTSMGGIVSMNAAGLRPDLVRSLTVIEPPAFALAADQPDVRRVSDAMKRHWRDADPAQHHGFISGFVAALEMEMVLSDPLPAPLAAAVRNLVTERPWKVDVPVGVIADAAFAKLVVTGGWSMAFDAICRRLADLFQTDLHVLTGAGHGVQKVGAPFNSLLTRLIDRAARHHEGAVQ